MSVVRSYWRGWARAAGLWPVVVLLYLVDSALALILAIPPAAHLGRVFGHSTMAPDLLGPITMNLLIEVVGRDGLPSFPWLLYLLVPFLFLIVGTFLRGGVLGALAKGPQAFRWHIFFADCGRFFGRLLLLLLFFLPGLILVALLFIPGSLTIGLVRGDGPLGLVLAGGLLAILMLLLVAVLDYARISLVLEPERSIIRHLGRSMAFVVRRLPRVLLLTIGFSLAAALIAAAYPVLLQVSPFFGGFLSGLILQQVTMLAASWQRLATLGGEMALYQEHQPR